MLKFLWDLGIGIFGGVIPLIQRASLRKNLMDWIPPSLF